MTPRARPKRPKRMNEVTEFLSTRSEQARTEFLEFGNLVLDVARKGYEIAYVDDIVCLRSKTTRFEHNQEAADGDVAGNDAVNNNENVAADNLNPNTEMARAEAADENNNQASNQNIATEDAAPTFDEIPNPVGVGSSNTNNDGGIPNPVGVGSSNTNNDGQIPNPVEVGCSNTNNDGGTPNPVGVGSSDTNNDDRIPNPVGVGSDNTNNDDRIPNPVGVGSNSTNNDDRIPNPVGVGSSSTNNDGGTPNPVGVGSGNTNNDDQIPNSVGVGSGNTNNDDRIPNPVGVGSNSTNNDDRIPNPFGVGSSGTNNDVSSECPYFVPQQYLGCSRDRLQMILTVVRRSLVEAREEQIKHMKALKRVDYYWQIIAVYEIFLASFLELPRFGHRMTKAYIGRIYPRTMSELGAGDECPSFELIWELLRNFQPHPDVILQVSDDEFQVSFRFPGDRENILVRVYELKREIYELEQDQERLVGILGLRRKYRREQTVLPPRKPACHYCHLDEITSELDHVDRTLTERRLEYTQAVENARSTGYWEIVGGLFVAMGIAFYAIGRDYALSIETLNEIYNDQMAKNVPLESMIPPFRTALQKAKEFNTKPFMIRSNANESEIWMHCPTWSLMERTTKEIRRNVRMLERVISWLQDDENLRYEGVTNA